MLCSRLPDLQHLILREVPPWVNLKAQMPILASLQELELGSDTASQDPIHQFCSDLDDLRQKSTCSYVTCAGLRTLQLTSTVLSGTTAAAIAATRQLTELRLCYTEVPHPQQLAAALAQLPQLHTLELCRTLAASSSRQSRGRTSVWVTYTMFGMQPMIAFLKELTAVSQLRLLRFKDMCLIAEVIQQLPGLTQLTSLQFSSCFEADDDPYNDITKAKRLLPGCCILGKYAIQHTECLPFRPTHITPQSVLHLSTAGLFNGAAPLSLGTVAQPSAQGGASNDSWSELQALLQEAGQGCAQSRQPYLGI
jgi:hypothetical protein